MVKFFAVASTSGLNCGESPAFRSAISTAVTMFVFTPHIRWHLTQSCPDRSTPYFSSYQRTNREVEKPDESGAKLVSTARNGRLLRAIKSLSIGARLASSMRVLTLLGCMGLVR